RAREQGGVLVADAERVVGGNVVERLHQHRHAGGRDVARDLPAFLGARQHELQLELAREAQRGRDVAPPVRVGDERLLRVQHRQQRLEVAGRRRQRLYLGGAEVHLATLVFERVAEYVPETISPSRTRAAGVVLPALGIVE